MISFINGTLLKEKLIVNLCQNMTLKNTLRKFTKNLSICFQ